MSSFATTYLTETAAIATRIDAAAVDRVAEALAAVRDGGGRLFVVGVGGSAAHASHAVCNFRKLCALESYAPTDNVAELTARVNDEGWDGALAAWLEGSRLGADDALLVLSVGGGSEAHEVSVNLVRAIQLARRVGAKVFGIVGRDGGYTREAADACVVVPVESENRITPHSEGMCAVLWHLLVSPALQVATPKWESLR